MKWLLLAYCIVSVNAALCGILAIIVSVIRIGERNDEVWKRLDKQQERRQAWTQ